LRNTLYYGDNLDVLRRHVADASVDLVYLDPPFNSNQDYNVLFKGDDGHEAAAQVKAFGDTWTWDRATRLHYEELSERGGKVGALMDAFLEFLGPSDMMAYLTMMAPRLVELRRVMKPTASIYLHCDPTASHYLKLLMDAVFATRLRCEVIWDKGFRGTERKRNWQQSHDTLLFYTATDEYTWNDVYQEYADPTMARYNKVDEDGKRYALIKRRRTDGSVYYGKTYPKAGGKRANDIISIPLLAATDSERLGYPTQKPEALLERLVRASSNEGDVVLDPFCGCGTAIAVAQRLGRRWIGIDITHLAIGLMKHRLAAFGPIDYAVVGEPTTSEEAAVLAAEDPYQFQWWALGLVGARPADERKGADRGIDGRRTFFERGGAGSVKRQVIFSVKGGHAIPAHAVRDLRGTIEREAADFGVLVSLAAPTKAMLGESDAAGFVTTHGYEGERKHPRLQCVTVGELLDGKRLDLPPFAFAGGDATLKPAPERKAAPAKKGPTQANL